MTQQPYAPAGYPPQYPQAPQQPPAQPYAQPQYPQQPQAPYYPPAQPAGYPPQGYGQPYPQQGPPQPPLAQGSLDDFYSQPSAGSGPGLSWHDGTPMKNPRPVGTTWVGVVVRDVTSADVQQQTSPQGVPAVFRDGRPKFQMKVPLKQVALFADPNLTQQLALPADMPEGEATWYVRGQGRDELTRAMAEAGCEGAPKAGAIVVVTLVNRRPNGGGMQPSNIVQVRYQPADAGQGAVQAPTPPAAPVQQAPVPQAEQPPAYAPPQQYGPPQGVPAQAPQQPQYAPQAPPLQQPPVQQVPPQAPLNQAPAGVQAPPNMSPEQAALWNKITSGSAA